MSNLQTINKRNELEYVPKGCVLLKTETHFLSRDKVMFVYITEMIDIVKEMGVVFNGNHSYKCLWDNSLGYPVHLFPVDECGYVPCQWGQRINGDEVTIFIYTEIGEVWMDKLNGLTRNEANKAVRDNKKNNIDSRKFKESFSPELYSLQVAECRWSVYKRGGCVFGGN